MRRRSLSSWVVITVAWLITQAGSAHIGWTEKQCVEAYGKSVEKSTIEGRTFRIYRKSGFIIGVLFGEDEKVFYCKYSKLTDDFFKKTLTRVEIEALHNRIEEGIWHPENSWAETENAFVGAVWSSPSGALFCETDELGQTLTFMTKDERVRQLAAKEQRERDSVSSL